MGHVRVCEMLVSKGADILHLDNLERTVLHHITQAGQVAILRIYCNLAISCQVIYICIYCYLVIFSLCIKAFQLAFLNIFSLS